MPARARRDAAMRVLVLLLLCRPECASGDDGGAHAAHWPLRVREMHERLRGDLKHIPRAVRTREPPAPPYPPYTPPAPPPEHLREADHADAHDASVATEGIVKAHETSEARRRAETRKRVVEVGAAVIGKAWDGDKGIGFPCLHHLKVRRPRAGCTPHLSTPASTHVTRPAALPETGLRLPVQGDSTRPAP